jgi:hypothetical protein
MLSIGVPGLRDSLSESVASTSRDKELNFLAALNVLPHSQTNLKSAEKEAD